MGACFCRGGPNCCRNNRLPQQLLTYPVPVTLPQPPPPDPIVFGLAWMVEINKTYTARPVGEIS